MTRIEVVQEKIRRIGETADLLRDCLPGDINLLRSDRDRLDLVSFRVYLLVQEALDLAAHVVAERGWGPASTLRDHFAILQSRGVLDAELASQLAASVKVRDLIGHGYARVDPAKLHAAAGELLTLVGPCCAAILAFAESTRD